MLAKRKKSKIYVRGNFAINNICIFIVHFMHFVRDFDLKLGSEINMKSFIYVCGLVAEKPSKWGVAGGSFPLAFGWLCLFGW